MASTDDSVSAGGRAVLGLFRRRLVCRALFLSFVLVGILALFIWPSSPFNVLQRASDESVFVRVSLSQDVLTNIQDGSNPSTLTATTADTDQSLSSEHLDNGQVHVEHSNYQQDEWKGEERKVDIGEEEGNVNAQIPEYFLNEERVETSNEDMQGNQVHSEDAEQITYHSHTGLLMPTGPPLQIKHNERQAAVVNAFLHAWNGYKKYAWGMDELRPITKSGGQWFGLGITIVDSLDTMWLMGLGEEFKEAREWVATKLNLAQNKEVSVFEVTIRALGGLLGAYHLSNDDIFLKKATELGDRLLPAFNTPTGIPRGGVNLYSRSVRPSRGRGDSIVSEVSTLQLEFRDLSHSTGDPKYQKAVDRAMESLQAHVHGLVTAYVSFQTGALRTGSYTLGGMCDSYYEYLVKQWVQSGKKEDKFRDWYLTSAERIEKVLIRRSEPSKFAFSGKSYGGGSVTPVMDHLACFYPGTLALGAYNGLPEHHLQLAKDLTYSCYQAYAQTSTGIGPESVSFRTSPGTGQKDFVASNKQSLLRPETVESIFILYRTTKDEQYREWGWKIFQAFEKYAKVPDGGYSSLRNVDDTANPGFLNKMESFFLAETLKYLFLLFSDDSVVSLDEWVFNTEAHPLPIWR